MSRSGRWRRTEKGCSGGDFVENNPDAESTQCAKEMAASATVSGADVPATNEDILTVLRDMKNAVDGRFDEVNGSLSSLKSTLSAIGERVSTAEVTLVSHERRLDELERQHESLMSQCLLQQAKLDDLEAAPADRTSA